VKEFLVPHDKAGQLTKRGKNFPDYISTSGYFNTAIWVNDTTSYAIREKFLDKVSFKLQATGRLHVGAVIISASVREYIIYNPETLAVIVFKHDLRN
jgi:hypothetical protein